MLCSVFLCSFVFVAGSRRQYTEEEAIVVDKLKTKIMQDLNISAMLESDIEKRLPDPVKSIQASLKVVPMAKMLDTKTMTVINTGPDECLSDIQQFEFDLSRATICGHIKVAYLALRIRHYHNIERAFIQSGHRRIRVVDLKANHAHKESEFPGWLRVNIKHDLYFIQWQLSYQRRQELKLMITVQCRNGHDIGDPPYLRIVKVVQSRKRRETVRSPCSSRSKDCCLAKVSIDFHEMGWSFILQPRVFEFQFCTGSCSLHPFDNDRQFTLISQMENQGKSSSVRCCVPAGYEPNIIVVASGDQIAEFRNVEWSASECDCVEK